MPRSEPTSRILVLTLGLALLGAGCVGADDTAEATADVALDTAAAVDSMAEASASPPQAPEDDPPANATQADPTAEEDADAADAQTGTTDAPPPVIVTKVYEREGEIEPLTFVGAGPLIGFEDPYLEFPVPTNAVAVRATLFWNGTEVLDLAVEDDTVVCSGYVGIATCNVELVTKSDAQGRHWLVGAGSPATLTFDEAAIRAGCPADDCAWQAIAYAEGDVATTFHLIVEVDALE